jgi:hypothetical protein
MPHLPTPIPRRTDLTKHYVSVAVEVVAVEIVGEPLSGGGVGVREQGELVLAGEVGVGRGQVQQAAAGIDEE